MELLWLCSIPARLIGMSSDQSSPSNWLPSSHPPASWPGCAALTLKQDPEDRGVSEQLNCLQHRHQESACSPHASCSGTFCFDGGMVSSWLPSSPARRALAPSAARLPAPLLPSRQGRQGLESPGGSGRQGAAGAPAGVKSKRLRSSTCRRLETALLTAREVTRLR